MLKLANMRCWGARYFPLDTLVRWLGRRIKRDGKRVKKSIRQLIKEGYVIPHKGGETTSLNPGRSREIVDYVRRVLEEASEREHDL